MTGKHFHLFQFAEKTLLTGKLSDSQLPVVPIVFSVAQSPYPNNKNAVPNPICKHTI